MRLSWSALVLLASVGGLTAVSGQTRAGGQTAAPTQLAIGAAQRSEMRAWSQRLDALVRSGELSPRIVRRDTVLADGRVHERYDQFFNGVRVVGGDIVRQQRDGSTESIYGTLHGAIDVATDPGIGEDAAIEAFGDLAGRALPQRRPELVVLPKDGGGYALAWRAHVWTDRGWMHTFLDAHDGTVVLQYNDLQTQAAVGTGTGVLGDRKKVSTLAAAGRFLADDQLRPPTLVTYDMRGDLSRAIALLDGTLPSASDIANDTDNDWTDAANVDAHVHLGWTYDYLFKRFGRKGLDDRDVPVRAITHPVRRNDVFTASDAVFGIFFLNAFWCGGCGPHGQGMMMFGEGLPGGVFLSGSGKYYDYFSGALDIVAHELAHGLTDYSSGLVYRNEAGALNEAFSDIVGTSVEFFFHTPGVSALQPDYLIGEDISRPGGERSMANPGAFGDPDHYSRRYLGPDDNGGVHSNSGIANHAFYLAIEGGTNRTSGLRVDGVGAVNREQIEKVFYRAFVYLLPAHATFSIARAATIQSARDLYGVNSAPERAVTQAWTAVGVF